MIYLDTGAFIKLYIKEEHSERVDSIVTSQDEPLPVWFLHQVEIRNAFNLKLFRGEFESSDINHLSKLFNDRMNSGYYTTPELDLAELTTTAISLTDHTGELGCRSLDILHVAAAKILRVERFVTFDERQKRLANTVGLATER